MKKIKGYAIRHNPYRSKAWQVIAVYETLLNVTGDFDTIISLRKKKHANKLVDFLCKLDSVPRVAVPIDPWNYRSEGIKVDGWFYEYTHPELTHQQLEEIAMQSSQPDS